MSLSSVDLNLLLILHTVVSERSVARAAARLHVTPSAVSNALARLRAVVGDPLVTRKGRGIVPTPRAIEIAPAIARGLKELELALHTVPFDAAGCTRTFTLAVADAGQVTWLPRIGERMAAQLPRAHLRVVGIDSLIALGDLASSEVDLQLGVPARGAGIHVDPVFDERLVLVAREGHETIGPQLSRRALAAVRHVGIELVPGKGFRDRVAAAYVEAGVRREVAITVPTFSAAATIVASTDLVASLPASLVTAIGGRLGLRIVRTPLLDPVIPMALCWHDRTHTDPAAVAFRRLVRAAVVESGRDTRSRARMRNRQ